MREGQESIRVEYDRAVLSNMITSSFNFEELDEFAFKYFPEVKNTFSPALTLSLRVIALIEYCERRNDMDILVDKVKESRPKVYDKYKDSLVISTKSTTLIEFESDSDVNLEDLTEEQKKTLSLSFKIGLAHILGVAPREIRIMDIVSGSIKIIVEIPKKLIPNVIENDERIRTELGFSNNESGVRLRAQLAKVERSDIFVDTVQLILEQFSTLSPAHSSPAPPARQSSESIPEDAPIPAPGRRSSESIPPDAELNPPDAESIPPDAELNPPDAESIPPDAEL